MTFSETLAALLLKPVPAPDVLFQRLKDQLKAK